MLPILLSTLALAAPTVQVDLLHGVVAGSSAVATHGALTLPLGPIFTRVEGGWAHRLSGDEPRAGLAGLATLTVGLPVALGPRATFSPVLNLDALVLEAGANDCVIGFACRFPRWVEAGGLGVALEPSAGFVWDTRADQPDQRGFELGVSVQSTSIYDMSLPVLPKVAVGWRIAHGWRVGLRLERFQSGITFGKVL